MDQMSHPVNHNLLPANVKDFFLSTDSAGNTLDSWWLANFLALKCSTRVNFGQTHNISDTAKNLI